LTGFYPLSNSFATDLEGIKKRGTLRMVTAFNPTGYFIYKDEPLGFEYDFLKAFASSQGLDLEVVLVNDPRLMYEKLYDASGDIVAYHIPSVNMPEKYLRFTEPYVQTEQVIVQRKVSKKDPAYIGNWQQMKDRNITVAANSHYIHTLQDLNFELGNKIKMSIIDENKSTEDLIRMVANGEIDYTIANKEIALINKGYYQNLDIETPVTPPQDIAFAVHRKHKSLLKALNQFIEKSRKDQFLYTLYERYFQTSRLIAYDDQADALGNEPSGTFISEYDALIQQYAAEIGWDWRLVAALIWQESRFNPRARSWAGATGLMQLMPATAKRFGLQTMQEIYQPELNIKAGTKYIAWLDDFWNDIPDPLEKLKFIMASYNAGEGHVKDAQRLASKYGSDPNRWDGHVEYYLLNKSKPQFYLDPVCKYGYCRGSEPFNYVRSIIKKYDHFKNSISGNAVTTYNFSLDFSPAYELSIESASGSIGLKRKPLFNERELFQERTLSRESATDTTGKYHNTLPLKPGYQKADSIFPKRPALQQRKSPFQQKKLFPQ
jgi:membrane-bound lytic murein transglycosylase F